MQPEVGDLLNFLLSAFNGWILVTRNQAFLRDPGVRARVKSWENYSGADIVWTDDYASLLQVLKY